MLLPPRPSPRVKSPPCSMNCGITRWKPRPCSRSRTPASRGKRRAGHDIVEEAEDDAAGLGAVDADVEVHVALRDRLGSGADQRRGGRPRPCGPPRREISSPLSIGDCVPALADVRASRATPVWRGRGAAMPVTASFGTPSTRERPRRRPSTAWPSGHRRPRARKARSARRPARACLTVAEARSRRARALQLAPPRHLRKAIASLPSGASRRRCATAARDPAGHRAGCGRRGGRRIATSSWPAALVSRDAGVGASGVLASYPRLPSDFVCTSPNR